MAASVHAREQRLRKQAELQSLYSNLANLREGAEASYIAANAVIPERLVKQINELRLKLQAVEQELVALGDEATLSSGRQSYWEAFEAEQAGDLDEALKLCKKAARQDYPDAAAAIRSLRYFVKTSKSKAPAGPTAWISQQVPQSKNRWLIGLAAVLILVLVVAFAINGLSTSQPEAAVAGDDATGTATATAPAVILIVPDTPTPTPTTVPTDTPLPPATGTPVSAATDETPTATPLPSPTLRPAPKILEPKDGLVWLDGAIVFEFERLDLAYDELYCLNTLRGYDRTNTENWSFPPVGNKEPKIPVEAHVFRIAKLQDMRCIVWSAAIGKGSCENVISKNTETRMIGLPRPCDFDR